MRTPTTRRSRTLFGVAKHRAHLHRFTIARWIIGVGFTVGIAVLPFTGLLRIDVLGGENIVAGEVSPLLQTIRAFAFTFLGVNIAIILANRFLGRWLCGFVCPVGSMNRFSEWIRWRTRKLKFRLLGVVGLFGSCLVLSVVGVAFFVSPVSAWNASPTVQVVLAGATLLVTAGLFVIVQFQGMNFCRSWCPSGVYFAVLGPESSTGIEFEHADNCTKCGACESVCPVDLDPKHIPDGPLRASRGFYPDDLTNFANCLRCGDCITVCESAVPNDATPLRLGFMDKIARAKDGRRGHKNGVDS